MGDSIRTTGELTSQNAPVLGGRCVFDIPRTSDLEQINVLFTGSLQLTVGSAGLITDGILNLITAVELLANSGRDVLMTCPFNILVQGNIWRRKRGYLPAITQPGVGIAVNAFSVAAAFDVSAFAATRPKDTALRENNYESLQLAFRFAPDVSGVYQAGFTNTTNVLSMVVSVREIIELPSDPRNPHSASDPVARLLITSNDIAIAGAGNKIQYKLTPGQGLRGIILRVQSTAVPPVLNDTTLTRTRLYVGKVQRVDKAGATIKGEMATSYVINPPTGYYFLDFADRNGSDDHLNDVLNLDPSHTNGADSIIEFDVSAACTISVMQVGYIPLAS